MFKIKRCEGGSACKKKILLKRARAQFRENLTVKRGEDLNG